MHIKPVFWIFLPAALVGTWWVYRDMDFKASAEGKLKRIVESGKARFRLREILGSDWTAVCILPSSYAYETTGAFPQWLSGALGRKVNPEREYMDLLADGSAAKVLFTPQREAVFLSALPWQREREDSVLCTHDPDAEIMIRHEKNAYWFEHSLTRFAIR